MPELLDAKASELLRELNDLNLKLTWTSNESTAGFVEYFVIYMQNVVLVSQKLDDLTVKNGEISQLFLLIMDYKIKITESNKTKIQEASQQLVSLRRKIDEA